MFARDASIGVWMALVEGPERGAVRKLTTSMFPAERHAQMVARGTLAMPDFQRDFVWEPSHVVDFLESVADSWPTGSLLFLEAPP